MNLITSVKYERVNARKAGDAVKSSLLSLLLGELETVSKRDGSDITDEKVIAAAKKIIKSNKETEKLAGSSDKLNLENLILESFLPKQLTEDEIRVVLNQHVFGNVGEAMKILNTKFPGQFDKGVASKIAKEVV